MNIGFGLGLPFGRPSARANLNALLADGSTVANYQMGVGITGATNASAWANQIGAAGPLLQATGAAQPAIQADGSLLFDGTDDFMAATFTLNQPCEIYIVFKPVTLTSNDTIYDGSALNTMRLYQDSLTTIAGFAGSVFGSQSISSGAYQANTAVFNGAASSIKINQNAAVTGASGASNAGGFTLCADGALAGTFSNNQVAEVIIRNVVSAATQALIQAYLKAIYGTP